MKTVPDDAALLDTLFDEDALYDEDTQLGGRELPPQPWRVVQRSVEEVLEFSHAQLDLAWRQLRDHARRERMAAAVGGAFERRVNPEPLSRRGLLAKLAALQDRHGAVLQVAYRKLESVDDDELRALVGELESLVARREATVAPVAEVRSSPDPAGGPRGMLDDLGDRQQDDA